MPAAARPPARRTKTLPPAAFVSKAEAMAVLGIECECTFRRQYQRLFTDHRPPHLSKHRTPLRIARRELDLVVNDGWVALADYRCRLGKD